MMLQERPDLVGLPASARIKQLGDAVAARWNAALREPAAFADIAADELLRSGVLESVSAADIIAWVLSREDVPPQQFRDFGDPPLNLFIGDGFYVEGILWREGDTAIHEHGFDGAFGVLQGSSVHVRYRTRALAVESRDWIACESEMVDAELLSRGAVRRIDKGTTLTHSLFHLESPTFSIVVRTDGDASLDQHVLFPNNALVLTTLKEPEESMVRLMESLAVIDRDLFETYLGHAVASWSAYAAWRVVSTALAVCPDVVDRFAARARGDAARRLAMLIPAAHQQRELKSALKTYAALPPGEVRTFVALLINVPSRRDVLRLLALRYPGENAVRTAGALIEQFAEATLSVRFAGALARVASNALECGPDAAQISFTDDKLRRVWQHVCALPLFRSLVHG